MASGLDYRRDWELLAAVAREFSQMKAQFSWWKKVPLERIRRDCGEILSDESPWPASRYLRAGLEQDIGLIGHLETCFNHVLKPWERDGYSFEEVLQAVLTRLFCTVLRNAEKWLKKRRPEDVHWLRNQNTLNLKKEIDRAIKDLRKREEGGPPLAPPPAIDSLPPIATQTGYDRDPERRYDGRGTTSPEDRAAELELLEELCRSVSESDAMALRHLFATSEDSTAEGGGASAPPSWLSEDGLNAIYRRLTRRRD